MNFLKISFPTIIPTPIYEGKSCKTLLGTYSSPNSICRIHPRSYIVMAIVVRVNVLYTHCNSRSRAHLHSRFRRDKCAHRRLISIVRVSSAYQLSLPQLHAFASMYFTLTENGHYMRESTS